jgi:cytochrome c peroxidase
MQHTKITVIALFVCLFAGFQLLNGKRASSQASGLAATTGFSATDNIYGSKVGLYWDTMRGAVTYRVFRSATNDPTSAVDIGTSVSNVFFDTDVPAGQNFYYWVRAENSLGVSPLSAVDTGSRTGTQPAGVAPPPMGPPPAPPANPVTAAKTALGKTLFWDEQMSSTRTVACGTCHFANSGGVDKRSVAAGLSSIAPGPDGLRGTPDDIRGSQGVPLTQPDGTYQFLSPYALDDQVTTRRSMSSVDAGFSSALFWDGRAGGQFRDPITNAVVIPFGAALESQVLEPAVSNVEMAHTGRNWSEIASQIAAAKPLALSPSMPASLSAWIGGRTYPQLFAEAFGTAEVTPVRIAMAVATYERSLYSDQTPFDRLNDGINTLTAAENRGRQVFLSPVGSCTTCHSGFLTSDDGFFNTGVRPQNEDTGRFQVTNSPADRGTFRTPTLRNAELRGSFFHNGQITTLEGVVDFYNRGGDFNAPNKAPQIRPLGLSANQRADLVAFLKRPMTDPRAAAELPPFDRPVLYTESGRVPQIVGSGRGGSNGIVPQIRAISPPLAGNPNFTVSLSSALGNSPSVLVIDEADPGVGSAIPTAGSFARVTATTQNTGAGNGWVSLSLPVPDNASLVGRTFFARWYITDGGAVNGFAVSPAVRFTIFGDAAVSTTLSISGRVVTPQGLGLRNASVQLTDPMGNIRRATTSSFGIFTFAGVPSATTYFASVTSKRYRFAPVAITPTANLTDLDFVGQE